MKLNSVSELNSHGTFKNVEATCRDPALAVSPLRNERTVVGGRSLSLGPRDDATTNVERDLCAPCGQTCRVRRSHRQRRRAVEVREKFQYGVVPVELGVQNACGPGGVPTISLG